MTEVLGSTGFQSANAAAAEVRKLLAGRDFSRAEAAAKVALAQFPQNLVLQDLAFALDQRWHAEVECQRYRLRATRPADLPFFQACFADCEFMDKFHPVTSRQRSPEALKQSLAVLPYPVVQVRAVHRVIESTCDVPANSEIAYCALTPSIHGLISLVDIDVTNRRAEMVIGVPLLTDRGNGIALTAGLLLFDFAFNHVGLKKVTSVIIGDNPHSHKSTLAGGFVQEASRKQHIRAPGTTTWLNSAEYGIVDEDFRKNVRLSRLSKRLLDRDITRLTVH